MFDRKAVFGVPTGKIEEDALMELALEAGAEDVKLADDEYEVLCDPAAFSAVAEALEQKGVVTTRREIVRIPTSTVDLDAENGRKVLKLMEKLDDQDDVQAVASNFNITEEAMAELGES
jgi:transcriptional/translational regulatory protein YebC/TACO1